MRRTVLLTAATVLLAGPTALAFFAGGYFDGPRLVAALVAWTLVLFVALASPRPLPRSRSGKVALAGLALIAAWTGASFAWAPLSGPATANLVRLLLYVAVLLAAVALLRGPPASRAVEPILALGPVVVIGYGLSGRLLPGLIHLTESATANGRLEQPITYWNAEGALAAIGFVLCARLAGEVDRAGTVRVSAAAASGPLGMGVYLSLSRGAIAAAAVGLIVLLAADASRAQLRALTLALGAGLVAAATSAAFPGVASLDGSMAARERDGAIVLVVLLAVMAVAGIVQARLIDAERRGRVAAGAVRFGKALPAAAAAAAVLGLAGLVVGGLRERGSGEVSPRQHASRLTSVQSRRYDYWRLGLRAFARHPVNGLGSGGFRVVWLRERPVPAAALEVHSLPLEMAAELGIPGLLGLAMLVGGVGVAAGRALRASRALAPGACAALTVWFLHAAIDWDWQLPAVTLPAIVLAGALVAASEEQPDAARALRPEGTRETVAAPGCATARA